MRIRRVLLVGLLTLVLGTVAYFPARVAYHWFAPEGLRVGGISGSIWNGGATDAAVAGIYLRDIRWDFDVLPLARGRLAWSVKATPASGFIDGRVALGVGGTLMLEDVTGSMPLELLRGLARNPALAGSLSVEIERLEAAGTVPNQATGSFRVANLVDPRIYPGSLGSYQGEAVTGDAGIVVTYEDTDGLVDIEGRIDIAPDGAFRHTAKLRAKRETPPGIGQFIAALPLAADGSDWHEYVLGEGRL